MLSRVSGDPNLDREAAIVLPHMGFEITNIVYGGDRKLNTMGRYAARNSNDPNKFYYQFNPVPVDIQFELYILCKNQLDGTRIIEQIIPFFTPDYTIKCGLIDDLPDHSVDIPIEYAGMGAIEDIYEGDFSQRKVLMYVLSFRMRAQMYGPVRQKAIIKYVITNFRLGEQEDEPEVASRMTVTPGLTANGEPTSNSAASIAVSLIDVNDDFGFCVEVEGEGVIFS